VVLVMVFAAGWALSRTDGVVGAFLRAYARLFFPLR